MGMVAIRLCVAHIHSTLDAVSLHQQLDVLAFRLRVHAPRQIVGEQRGGVCVAHEIDQSLTAAITLKHEREVLAQFLQALKHSRIQFTAECGHQLVLNLLQSGEELLSVKVLGREDNALGKNLVDGITHVFQQIISHDMTFNAKLRHTHIPNVGIRLERIPQRAIHIKYDGFYVSETKLIAHFR